MIKIESVIFDVDDTLYNQLTPFELAYNKNFSNNLEIPIQELYKESRHFSDLVFQQTVQGQLSLEEMHSYRITQACLAFGLAITPAEAWQFQQDYQQFQKGITLSEEMVQVLDYCQDQAVQLGIITNGPAQHQWNKIKQLGIEKWIPAEDIFVSGELNCEKPSQEIFQYAERQLKLIPSETLYVGDSFLNDVVGAKQAGWQALWLTKRGQEAADFASMYQPDYVVQGELALLESLKLILAKGR